MRCDLSCLCQYKTFLRAEFRALVGGTVLSVDCHSCTILIRLYDQGAGDRSAKPLR